MKNFNFDTSTEILFGKGKVMEVIPRIKKLSYRLLLAYGGGSIKKIGLYDEVVQLLKSDEIDFIELSDIKPNPRISSVREGIRLCREHKLEFILAVGGGSVLDCCKAIAAGFYYNGDPWSFMIGKAVIKKALPVGAILTLAATGSEMNGNAVISNQETLEKRAMISPLLRPVFSVLDPEYTYTVNKWQTAAGITDIMSHIFEFYFTPDIGTHVQDALAESLMKVCIECGPVAINQPRNYEARANILWASTLALNGLLGAGKNQGDWASHAIEHEISAIYDLTHGAGLSIVFPAWMNYVLEKDNAWKFAKMARNTWNIADKNDISAAKKGIIAVQNFFSSLGMPVKLKEVDIDDTHLIEMGKKACKFGSIGVMKSLSAEDVTAILRNAM